jgi:acyl carrier protein
MDIEQQLIHYFKDFADVEITPDTPLLESGVVDSMGVMTLVAFIESEYSLVLDMDDLTIENFATVNDIKNFINGKKMEQ